VLGMVVGEEGGQEVTGVVEFEVVV